MKYKLKKIVDKYNKGLLRNNLIEMSEILGNRYELLKRNLIAGIFKGVGIGIGFTLVTATIVVVLQKIVKLNIPVIGEYVTDIVKIVERNNVR